MGLTEEELEGLTTDEIQERAQDYKMRDKAARVLQRYLPGKFLFRCGLHSYVPWTSPRYGSYAYMSMICRPPLDPLLLGILDVHNVGN
eukprot:6429358-Pyramimonas_sp.AAC.1